MQPDLSLPSSPVYLLEPPPLEWSILRYVFGQDGGP